MAYYKNGHPNRKRLNVMCSGEGCSRMLREGAWRHLCWECELKFKKEKTKAIVVSIIPIELEGVDRLREHIRVRDNRTCQLCYKVWEVGSRRFDVHHLDEERESTRDYKWDNEHRDRLITYCHKCHLNLHAVREKRIKGYGKKLLTAR